MTTTANIEAVKAELAACDAQRKALADKLEELHEFKACEAAVESGAACWKCLAAPAAHPQQTAACGCTWPDALCDACDAACRAVACDDCQREAYSEQEEFEALREQELFEIEHSASRLG